MTCTICDALQKDVLYEDALAAVIAPEKPAVSGHLLVVSKAHHPSLEEVPEDIVSHCFLVANKTSSLIFEACGAQGTNVIIQNGLSAGQTMPHFSISVLPRKEGDGMSFAWTPKKIPDQKMNDVMQTLKDECDYIGQTEEKNAVEIKKEEKKLAYSEENYLIKQLRRIP